MTANSDPAVLVLDSQGQCGLTVIRSLGRTGVTVTAASDTPTAVGMYSKYASGSYVHPPIADGESRFIDALARHLAEHSYDVVIPVDDGTTTVVSKYKSTLEATGTIVACADWQTFRLTADKDAFADFITELGLPTPATYPIESREQLADLSRRVSYPVLVKPESKSIWADGTLTEVTVADRNYAHSPADLLDAYDRVLDAYGEASANHLIVQEYVPGQTTTTVVLADDGDVLSYFQERRLRTFPSSGGNSALLEPVDDPRMLARTERVVEALSWTGPMMVEFMHTPADEYVIIEANGRYWGSLSFAISAGVDFPVQHLRLLLGLDPLAGSPPPGAYRMDFRYRRLLYEDVLWFLEQVQSGRPQALLPFLGAFVTAEQAFLSWDDWRPMAVAFANAPRLGLRALADSMTTRMEHLLRSVTPGSLR